MASSNPSIKTAEIPDEVPPRDTFTIPVTARQGKGGDPWGSSGACLSKTGDPTAWVTPVTLWVDGERRATNELCLANDNSRDTSFSVSLSPGDHRIEVRVHQVGDAVPFGQTWEQHLSETTHDDVSKRVTTAKDATDPSRQSPTEGVLAYLETLASSLGTSTTMIAVGAIGAVVLLGVL